MKCTMLSTLIAGLCLVAPLGCAHMSSSPGSYETVTLPGTGDSQDLLREIVKSYMAQYPDRNVVVPDSIGSGGGIKAVGTGASSIGRVARHPSSKELAQFGEFKYIEFARVPVAFVVSPRAGVRHLSAAQICAIYSGRLTNWKQVGGHDLPIDVQARPDQGSNMQTIRKQMACFASLQVTSKAHFNLRNALLVASMRRFAGAIGVMPLSEAQLHGFTTARLDGVSPTEPSYPLGIGLGFVYKQELSPSTQAFIDYLKSEPARDIMHKSGHLPVS